VNLEKVGMKDRAILPGLFLFGTQELRRKNLWQRVQLTTLLLSRPSHGTIPEFLSSKFKTRLGFGVVLI
jgi:hypothetical protein